MKIFKIIFLSAFCAIFLLASCQDQEFDKDQILEDTSMEFPPRPDLKIGETNWTGPSSKLNRSNLMLEGQSNGLSTIDLNSITPEDMVAALLSTGGSSPSISNVVYTGGSIAGGTFTGGTDIFGFEKGIVLSTGNIASIVGPNTAHNTSTNLGTPGDSDLSSIIKDTTYDAAVLEFDFECDNIQMISFQYVFSSEEYNEYVNSEFNDVFAFFLNGENIALVPGTATPVAINTVNCGNPFGSENSTNCDLFINNEIPNNIYNTEMDGFTVVFTASGTLQPGINKIKLAIADVQDRLFDSNVFVKGESLICGPQDPGILPEVLSVDIHFKPLNCPNPLNTRVRGLLPIALVGSGSFDVNDVDLSSLAFEGISPQRTRMEDVASPSPSNDLDCDCKSEGPDGFMDLMMFFDNQSVVQALGDIEKDDTLTLKLTGSLKDGTPIKGLDCVIVRH